MVRPCFVGIGAFINLISLVYSAIQRTIFHFIQITCDLFPNIFSSTTG
jgi:hypothetical protein